MKHLLSHAYFIFFMIASLNSNVFADDNRFKFSCDAYGTNSIIKNHQTIACQEKTNTNLHLNKFDALKNIESIKLDGDRITMQIKYVGDWVLTPRLDQLILSYRDALLTYNSKMIFNDAHMANFVFYSDNNSYWLSLTTIGNGIHQIKILRKTGIYLNAEYHIGQLKARIKRYGKIDFFKLQKDQNNQYDPKYNQNIDLIVSYLNQNADKQYYLLRHQDSAQKDEIDIKQSQIDAQKLRSVMIEMGIEPKQIEANGMGPLNPLKAFAAHNSLKRNNRFSLVLKR